VSTILDALRKLQRERAAESPSRDLRGALTAETPRGRARRRGGSSLWIVLALLVVSVAGGGYWLYSSGQLGALRAQYAGSAGDAMEVAEGEDRPVSEEEFAALEREIAAREAASPPEPEAASAPQVAAPPAAPAPRADTPETLAERARLEAALANARAAQETQRKAELEAAAAAAAPPPAPPVAEVPAVKPPAPEKPVEIAAQAPVAKPKAPAAKPTPPAAKAAPARPAPERRAAPAPAARVETESRSSQSAFPDVRVESIRWHPVPERRVASLQFERQNAPQAHEGDIVAGVLVYRIDPGAVELRIGTAHRVVSPAP